MLSITLRSPEKGLTTTTTWRYGCFDGGHSWDGTPFQTADFRHNLNVATLRRIDKWAGRA